MIETAPEDVAPQPNFLNGAVVGSWDASPSALMSQLQDIEDACGRTRPYPGAPRTLDLDLIVMGELVVEGAGLTVPHPRFRRRRFVLAPLVEIAPELVDPVSGRTMRQLLTALDEF